MFFPDSRTFDPVPINLHPVPFGSGIAPVCRRIRDLRPPLCSSALFSIWHPTLSARRTLFALQFLVYHKTAYPANEHLILIRIKHTSLFQFVNFKMIRVIKIFSVLALLQVASAIYQRWAQSCVCSDRTEVFRYPVRRFNQPQIRKLPPHLQRIKVTSSSVPVRTTTVQSLPYNFQKLGQSRKLESSNEPLPENITSIRQLLMETSIAPMKAVGPVARITQNISKWLTCPAVSCSCSRIGFLSTRTTTEKLSKAVGT